MITFRPLTLATSLMAATLLASPAFAIDLGGGIGGSAGGMIGPSGIGGSVGGTVNGTLDTSMRTPDVAGRANGVIDRTQTRVDRTVNSIEVPEAPSASELNDALKAAGYGDASLDTPVGSVSGSASGDGSADASVPAMNALALPDPVATANGTVDEVQATAADAAKRAAAVTPATPGSVSVSVSADAAATPSDDTASPEAAESGRETP